MLGLAFNQLLILAVVGVALVVLLLGLRALLRLTKVVVRIGCVGIVILLAIGFFVLRGVGG